MVGSNCLDLLLVSKSQDSLESGAGIDWVSLHCLVLIHYTPPSCLDPRLSAMTIIKCSICHYFLSKTSNFQEVSKVLQSPNSH